LARIGVSRIIVVIVLAIFILFALTPVYYTLITSLKSDAELYENPMGVPTRPTLENYYTVWFKGNFKTYFINSMIIATPTVCLVLLSSIFASYSLSKLGVPGRKFIMLIFGMGVAMSVPALIASLYLILKNLNLIMS